MTASCVIPFDVIVATQGGGRTKRLETRIQKIGRNFCRRVKWGFAMFVGGFKREYMLFYKKVRLQVMKFL